MTDAMHTRVDTPCADEWWVPFYDEHFVEMRLACAEPAEIQATRDFLVDTLALETGHRVFDQCCGIGRLALPLASWGAEVVGVDTGQGYAQRAEARAAQEGLTASFHEGDAFHFRIEPPCDAAFNWATSFGYAKSDETNLEMLRRAYESLKPGGRFALDTMNAAGVLSHFLERQERKTTTSLGEVRLIRESRYDAETGRLHQCWIYELNQGRELAYRSSVRAYTAPELVGLLAAAGFEEIQVLGSVAGKPLTMDDLRYIVLGRRPEGRWGERT